MTAIGVMAVAGEVGLAVAAAADGVVAMVAGPVVVAGIVTTVADATEDVRVRVHAHPDYIPQYASAGAAGADLRACLEGPVVLSPGARALIGTGIRMEIPPGYEGQVRPRSGLAIRNGITVVNSPGTIDSDYRGEVRVPLINLGQESVTIEPRMRIAQLVIAPVTSVCFVRDSRISETDRGDGGFGSTGIE